MDAPGRESPLVSVVIATYNSTAVLPTVLNALKRQTYPASSLEILAVDGGSTDETRSIAQRYGCRVLDNPKTDPVNAKYIGFMEARGKYLVYLDHDEELVNPEAIASIVDTFRRRPHVRTVDSSGYMNPPGFSVYNEYINEFGDPFTFFMYRQSRGAGFHLRSIERRARKLAEDDAACVFAAGESNRALFIENLAGAIATDLEYVRAHVPIERPQDLCHLFYLLNERGAEFAVAKENPLRHYSGDTLRKLMAKIRWRVKNNVHHVGAVGAAGFHGRQSLQLASLRYKKLLFLPYAFSLVAPLADAICLAVTRRKPVYLAHVFLVLYTASLIVYHLALRALGIKPGMKSYDEKKLIKQ
jgi:glycosyltransferase involved in cell wall biosynthesis